MDRPDKIRPFLAQNGWEQAKLFPMAGDASARRYWRAQSGGKTAVVMDDPTGSIPAFTSIAQHLSTIGLHPPVIWAQDPQIGLLLAEDLGDTVFSRAIKQDSGLEIPLYTAAADVLIHLRAQPLPKSLQTYGPTEMAIAIQPAFDWYFRDPTEWASVQRCFEAALTRLSPQTSTLVLRDYHAENLIWQPPRVRLLDFQDAVAGHPAYDLVSLLQDARRNVSDDCAQNVLQYYLRQTCEDPTQFGAAYAIQGAQRNLRILGIFARLSRQMGKKHYVDLIPRVWSYLLENLSHPELFDLKSLLMPLLPSPRPDHLNWLKS